MSMEKYKLKCSPVCRPQAVIQGDGYRISVLTEALLRLEYSEKNQFEDRATQMVVNRDFPEVAYEVKESEEELVLYTSCLEVHYNKKKFSTNGLSISVKGSRYANAIWYYGDEPNDLKGTARTLDVADGAIPLEHGVLSRWGHSVINDTGSMALTEDGWIEPRDSEAIDLYFFGYGHRYLDCLKDFYHLCGKTPLLPRYALGNWWSRYYRYTQDEYQGLMERFEAEKLPFTVAVIDMDWHLVDDVDEKYGSGWTGYTWNRKFFPDHVGFMKWLHDHGMKVSLNVHPADGIRAYEELYPRVAKAMGMNPEEEKTVAFDPTDSRFMEVYFEELHHPMEEEGVDFWWLDWQQGTKTKIPGLDPLWMLNHYHYLDSAWKGCRPITFSRYAGPGSHRYPIGFSGDTIVSWASLDFQPYFTNTASNIGYGWWSHDIGGHMQGVRDDEMTARWVQYGVFSPINRLHSSNNPFSGKEPWKYEAATKEVMERYLRLRHKMIPYLYTMNRRASRDDLPLIQPMYYHESEVPEAYRVPNEYYFGTELLVSPITTPMSSVCRMGKAKTWLPDGLWVDFFDGTVYQGGRMVNIWRGIENIPVLMKAGAIVPMSNEAEGDNSVDNPAAMELRIFPAADGEFILWEDQGDTAEDLDENWASTRFTVTAGEKPAFVIDAAQGNLGVIPEKRSWKLVFAATEYSQPTVYVDGNPIDYKLEYDKETQSLIVEFGEIDVTQQIRVEFSDGLLLAKEQVADRCFKILERAQMGYDQKAMAIYEVECHGKQAMAGLMALEVDESVLSAMGEILTAR